MTRVPRDPPRGVALYRNCRRSSAPSRRKFLSGVSAAIAATALAGCLDDDTETTDEREPDGDNDDDPADETTENGGEEEPTAPDSFDDPAELRGHSREYVELVATGETETAAEWFDPELAAQLSAADLDRVWDSLVGVEEPPESYRSVAHLGTNLGNHVFTVWATVAGDDYEFTITYSESGVAGFQISPIGEWTAPGYVREEGIAEESVTIETPLDCALDGTITVPTETDEQVPGVVIVHGNGPEDRDGTVGPNRPYRELAQGLASNGVAVLRYDKRTFACEVDLADATIDDIVTEDALAAVELLRNHEQVADDRVYVCGHSFGGLLAPRIAELDGHLAGTIMLAPGPGREFAETILDQLEHIFGTQNLQPSRREELLEEAEAEAEKMRTLDIDDDEVVRFGGREYHETLQAYDHAETAAALDVPQLLLQGENDWQITVEDDLPVWEDAIGDREDVTITVYEDLNHLFQESEPPLTQAEYAEPNSPVDERVIEDIVQFVSGVSGERVDGLARPLLPSR